MMQTRSSATFAWKVEGTAPHCGLICLSFSVFFYCSALNCAHYPEKKNFLSGFKPFKSLFPWDESFLVVRICAPSKFCSLYNILTFYTTNFYS